MKNLKIKMADFIKESKVLSPQEIVDKWINMHPEFSKFFQGVIDTFKDKNSFDQKCLNF